MGFTIVFSAWLLLFVDWRYLSTECAEDARGRASAGAEGTCDVLRDATFASPLSHRSTLANVVVVTYLLIFSLYWTWSLARLATDLRPLLEMRSFCNNKLQLSDRDAHGASRTLVPIRPRRRGERRSLRTFPGVLSAHPSLSIPALDAFQLRF